MSKQSLLGKRVLVTQADMFIGPILCEVFAKHGATVIASTDPLVSSARKRRKLRDESLFGV
jgi:2-keto-3-deoxy-L-fuconate dehydrogenase